ncbi:MAG: hypothetical protein WAP47_13125, partial [Candidatus Rokuibacteriota bacterium]
MISRPSTLALLDEVRLLKLYKKILRTERASLISFLPLWEASGSVAADLSGKGCTGAYVNVTLGQPGPGDGRPCAGFDGSTSYVDWYSAALAAAFNGAEGTVLIHGKVANAGVWADGATVYQAAYLAADNNNNVNLRHYPANTLGWIYAAGGTTKTVTLGSLSTLTFFSAAITWSASADKMIAYYNGAQAGVTQTGLGVW